MPGFTNLCVCIIQSVATIRASNFFPFIPDHISAYIRCFSQLSPYENTLALNLHATLINTKDNYDMSGTLSNQS